MDISKKVILVGNFGVGKTSLIQRFVHSKFSENYLTTIGVKIDKKVVDIDDIKVNLILWDIAGETSTLKVPKSYVLGAHGFFYVFDVSREETYNKLEDDLVELKSMLPHAVSAILGNKSDLIAEDQMDQIRSQLNVPITFTSAKEDSNVEKAFLELAKQLL
jgi:small GTP-binding protein